MVTDYGDVSIPLDAAICHDEAEAMKKQKEAKALAPRHHVHLLKAEHVRTL